MNTVMCWRFNYAAILVVLVMMAPCLWWQPPAEFISTTPRGTPQIHCTHHSFPYVHRAWSSLEAWGLGVVAREVSIQVPECAGAKTILLRVDNISISRLAQSYRPQSGRCLGIVEMTESPVVVQSSSVGRQALSNAEGCLRQCLQQFCCVGFAVRGDEGSVVQCQLLRCYHHTPRSAALLHESSSNVAATLYLLKHRRINPLSGKGYLSFRVLSPFGSVMRINDDAGSVVEMEIGVFDGLSFVADDSASLVAHVGLRSNFPALFWSSEDTLTVNGSAIIALPREVLVPYVGREVVVLVSAGALRSSSTHIRTTQAHYIIHHTASERRLHFRPSSNNQQASDVHRDAVAACCSGVNHLRSDECCIGGLISAELDHETYTMHRHRILASDPTAVGLMVTLRLVSNDSNITNCWSLSEGYYSQYTEKEGIAPFTQLVLHRRCAASWAFAHGDGGVFHFDFEEAMPNGLSVFRSKKAIAPLSVRMRDLWDHCGWGWNFQQRVTINPSRVEDASPLQPQHEYNKPKHDPPVLVSVVAHGCESCLFELLHNIALFASPAVVVLHINPDFWMPSEAEARRLTKPWAGRIHAVHVNTKSLAHEVSLFLHSAHLCNVAFMLELHRDEEWSHVIFLQRNERFVKRGVIEYIRQYNASLPIPSQAGGITFGHYSEFHHRSFVNLDDSFHSQFSFADRTFDNFFDEIDTLRTTGRLQGLRGGGLVETTEFPTAPMLVEGSFLSKVYAKEVAKAAGFLDPQRSLYPSRASLESEQCVVNEIVGEYALAMYHHYICGSPGARCGERISTLMWSDTFRNLTGRPITDPGLHFEVTPFDIQRVRCSPIGPPFAMKRFSANSSGSQFLRSISADVQRSEMFRDLEVYCR